MEDYNVKLVLILTIGFGLSSVLGYLTYRMKLSPILGYLIAGYIIGPFSPGITISLNAAKQLAEIGIILMMFGVGLRFRWQDLMGVRKIAEPGAVLQMFVSVTATALAMSLVGWPLHVGLIIGAAVGVASTIVVLRVYLDNNILDTVQGHISIAWLIVEDLLTVVVLLLMPTFSLFLSEGVYSVLEIAETFLFAVLKKGVLFLLLFTYGKQIVKWLLNFIKETKIHELFTITILGLTFVIATGSAYIFGTSFALGAFLAGMVIGQAKVSGQAAVINSGHMRDAFVSLFFLSIGMFLNPAVIVEHWPQFLSVLAIVLLVKPLTIYTIIRLWKYPTVVALGVALALAQIGEFSLILAEEALKLGLIPRAGFDIVASISFVSIALNPPIFKLYVNYLLKRPDQNL